MVTKKQLEATRDKMFQAREDKAMELIKKYVDDLPEQERKNCIIMGRRGKDSYRFWLDIYNKVKEDDGTEIF